MAVGRSGFAFSAGMGVATAPPSVRQSAELALHRPGGDRLKPGRLLPLTWPKWVKMTCSLLALPETAMPLMAATGPPASAGRRCRPATPRRRDLRCPAGCGPEHNVAAERRVGLARQRLKRLRPTNRVRPVQGVCARGRAPVHAPKTRSRSGHLLAGEGSPRPGKPPATGLTRGKAPRQVGSPEDGGGLEAST